MVASKSMQWKVLPKNNWLK